MASNSRNRSNGGRHNGGANRSEQLVQFGKISKAAAGYMYDPTADPSSITGPFTCDRCESFSPPGGEDGCYIVGLKGECISPKGICHYFNRDGIAYSSGRPKPHNSK